MQFPKIRRSSRGLYNRIRRFRKGDDGGGDTPLPIPNREVKPASADGTAGETPWESRSSPIFFALKYPEGGPVHNEELDQEFVERQRERLIELREELLRIRDGVEEDQRDLGEDEEDFTEHDSGDMSQSLFTREMDATVEQQVERRIGEIDRALKKIEEGTYGICDDTGEKIPKGRLEAVPEAIYTVEAQQRRERERRPPL